MQRWNFSTMVRNTLTDEMLDGSSHDFGKLNMSRYKTVWAICKEFNDKTDSTFFVRKRLGKVIVYKNPKEPPKEDRGEQELKLINSKKLRELREQGYTETDTQAKASYLARKFDGEAQVRKKEGGGFGIYDPSKVEPSVPRKRGPIASAIADGRLPIIIEKPKSTQSVRVKAYKLAKKYGISLGTTVNEDGDVMIYKKV